MGWVPEAQRHRCDAVHRRVHAAPAWWTVPLPGPDSDGLPLRMRRDHVSRPTGAGARNALCRAGIAVHDLDRVAQRARWLADPPDLGRTGSRHHGLGTGTHLDRSPGAQFPSASTGALLLHLNAVTVHQAIGIGRRQLLAELKIR